MLGSRHPTACLDKSNVLLGLSCYGVVVESRFTKDFRRIELFAADADDSD